MRFDQAVDEIEKLPPKVSTVEIREYGRGQSYAHRGEKTYCENGHLLSVFLRDAVRGAIPSNEMQMLHGAYIGMIKCPHCDGGVTYDGKFYFEAPI